MKKWSVNLLLGMLLVGFLFPIISYARTIEVSFTDLKENIDYLFPTASYLTPLNSLFKGTCHESWTEKSRGTLNSNYYQGIEIVYEAPCAAELLLTTELPNLSAYVISFSSPEKAEEIFNTWLNDSRFTGSSWELLELSEDFFTYQTSYGWDTDLLKTYFADSPGTLHYVTFQENVGIIINFYHNDGYYYEKNVRAFDQYIENFGTTLTLFNQLGLYIKEALDFYLSEIIPIADPSDYDYQLDSASYSLDLSTVFAIPKSGSLKFDLYLNDLSEIGSILDMTSADELEAGVFNLGINENAILDFNFYDSETVSTCRDESGWHHLYTETPISFYQWNTVKITYGAQGLGFYLNGIPEDSCGVYTKRADALVYLGDYPNDSVKEGFVGFVKDFAVEEVELETEYIFTDVSEEHEYAEAIVYLKEQGVIQGYEDGSFKPEQEINRVEILKMLLFGFGYEIEEEPEEIPNFSDIDSSAWYIPYLAKAYELGIIQGHSDGTYLPAHSVNRVEFLKILLKTYGIDLNDYPITEIYPDTEIDAWYASYVQYSKDYQLLDLAEDGNFYPGNPVTRGEVAETIYRLIK